MRWVVLCCFLLIEYSFAQTLYEKCKADMASNSAVCQSDTITSLIQEKNNQLFILQKDIWETTTEYETRRQNFENDYEQKIIQAINHEISINGAGKVTFVSYDADTQTIELSLAWSEKIKAIFDSKALPTEVTTILKREVGKKLFGSQTTIRFDIAPQYNAHQLKMVDIFILDDEEKHSLNNNPQTIGKWLTPAPTICTANGGEIDDNGICEASWEKAKAICGASGGSLPTIEELKEVMTECGGTNTTYGDSDYDSIGDKIELIPPIKSVIKLKGLSLTFIGVLLQLRVRRAMREMSISAMAMSTATAIRAIGFMSVASEQESDLFFELWGVAPRNFFVTTTGIIPTQCGS